ncbi:MAG: AAA family ATPase, partial [Daejeonella sp.]|nr:AAA family ATPase [Daejeonella sp.]
ALSQGFGFDGGTKGVQYDPRETITDLHLHLKSIKSFSKPDNYYFLRAETFYKVASYLAEIDPDREYGDYLHEFSHGEAFMKTLDKLGSKGLYIFDEPEAALSPSRQLAALAMINELAQNKHSQFIIATHSPILLSYPSAVIFRLDENGITQVQYEETEQYLITKEFLNNYKNILGNLLK